MNEKKNGGEGKDNTVFPLFWRNKRLESQGVNAGLWHSLAVFHIHYLEAFLKGVRRADCIERKEGTTVQKCSQSWC